MLKKLLPLDDIEMSLDFGIFASEALNGAVVEVTEVLFQNASRLANKAPIVIPGQIFRPSTIMQASPIPVGGQAGSV